MQTIALSDIKIPEFRQRKLFEDKKLDELADSILRFGLMQAIVLRPDKQTLVAGHRRLLAIGKLPGAPDSYKHNGEAVPVSHIPFVTTDQVDSVTLKRMELAENIDREDLTWQEKAQAFKEIHELEQSLNPQHTIKETATIIRKGEDPSTGFISRVSDNILLAKHLDDPDVQKATSAKEAMKIISRRLEREFKAALAEKLGPQAKQSIHSLYLGDCTQILPTLGIEQFDCVLTDPPYGINAEGFGSQSAVGHKYTDSYKSWTATQKQLAPLLFLALKRDAHLYMFCDVDTFVELKEVYTAAGFHVWRTPLIWSKHPIGMLPDPNYGPRRTYEAIMYARKGNRPVTAVYTDVLTYPPVENKEHAAQKPVEVYIDLLRRTCLLGESVLDCFAGSGVIFRAASQLGLRATGIEKDAAEYANAAAKLHLETKLETKDEFLGGDQEE